MRRCAILLTLAFALLAGPAAAQPAMLVLDGSGSMWGRVDNRSRIAIAQEAVAGLMAQWPANRPVGLVVYGHRRTQDCADVEVLRAPDTDAPAIAALARGITPRGRTPMAEAVRQAAAALGSGGGSVILVSDGIETCHPDPCAVAQAIARSGVRLVIHTIGFALADPTALAQLRCMAETTGGRALTARDAGELATALARAAEAPTPGPRAAAPRAEPVPVPSLMVALRLCATCDPMTGDARIVVRRGEEVVATDGDPFGRFFDLRPGDYTITVETPLFTHGPVRATIPPGGRGRVEVVLDAGWLVGDVRSEPSGTDVTDRARLDWHAGPDVPRDQPRTAEARGGPSFLVPVGVHRLEARIGNAQGSAEAAVTAGEVVVVRIPVRFGVLAVQRTGFGTDTPRVAITAMDAERTSVFDDWPAEERAEILLAPGEYRVSADNEGLQGSVRATVVAESITEVTVEPQE